MLNRCEGAQQIYLSRGMACQILPHGIHSLYPCTLPVLPVPLADALFCYVRYLWLHAKLKILESAVSDIIHKAGKALISFACGHP